jgi:hypothetical protein
MRRSLAIAIAAAVCGLVAAPAHAATPESGKVSKDAPRVEWNGEAHGYLFTALNILFSETPAGPQCVPTTCDEFTLEVADKDLLTVTASGGGAVGAFIGLQVVDPEGKSTFTPGGEGAPESTIQVANAPTGEYTVRVWTNNPQGFDGSYTGVAVLGPVDGAAPEEEAAPAPAPPAQPAPQPQPQPQPAPAAQQPSQAPPPAPSVNVLTKGASARKLGKSRRLTVALTSSGPLSGVTARLVRGKSTVATGKLAALDGSGNVVLRLTRKLTAGTHRLVLIGKSASGTPVATTVTLKITR